MAILDESRGGYRVFVGDLGSRVGKYELEREFQNFGPILDVWVARNPPGFAFLVYKYGEDAEEAVRKLHGNLVCGRRVRVEHAVPYGEQTTAKYSSRSERNRSSRRSHSRSRSPRRQRSPVSPSSRRKTRSHSRDRRSRSRKRDQSGSRKRNRTRSRSRSKKRDRSRSRSRKRERSRSRKRDRSGSRRRVRSGSRKRDRSGSRSIRRDRSKSRSKQKKKSRSRSPEKRNKERDANGLSKQKTDSPQTNDNVERLKSKSPAKEKQPEESMPEAVENPIADKVDENKEQDANQSDGNVNSTELDVRMSEEVQETGNGQETEENPIERCDDISNGKDESKEEKVKHHGRDKFDRIGCRADSPNSDGSED